MSDSLEFKSRKELKELCNNFGIRTAGVKHEDLVRLLCTKLQPKNEVPRSPSVRGTRTGSMKDNLHRMENHNSGGKMPKKSINIGQTLGNVLHDANGVLAAERRKKKGLKKDVSRPVRSSARLLSHADFLADENGEDAFSSADMDSLCSFAEPSECSIDDIPYPFETPEFGNNTSLKAQKLEDRFHDASKMPFARDGLAAGDLSLQAVSPSELSLYTASSELSLFSIPDWVSMSVDDPPLLDWEKHESVPTGCVLGGDELREVPISELIGGPNSGAVGMTQQDAPEIESTLEHNMESLTSIGAGEGGDVTDLATSSPAAKDAELEKFPEEYVTLEEPTSELREVPIPECTGGPNCGAVGMTEQDAPEILVSALKHNMASLTSIGSGKGGDVTNLVTSSPAAKDAEFEKFPEEEYVTSEEPTSELREVPIPECVGAPNCGAVEMTELGAPEIGFALEDNMGSLTSIGAGEGGDATNLATSSPAANDAEFEKIPEEEFVTSEEPTSELGEAHLEHIGGPSSRAVGMTQQDAPKIESTLEHNMEILSSIDAGKGEAPEIGFALEDNMASLTSIGAGEGGDVTNLASSSSPAKDAGFEKFPEEDYVTSELREVPIPECTGVPNCGAVGMTEQDAPEIGSTPEQNMGSLTSIGAGKGGDVTNLATSSPAAKDAKFEKFPDEEYVTSEEPTSELREVSILECVGGPNCGVAGMTEPDAPEIGSSLEHNMESLTSIGAGEGGDATKDAEFEKFPEEDYVISEEPTSGLFLLPAEESVSPISVEAGGHLPADSLDGLFTELQEEHKDNLVVLGTLDECVLKNNAASQVQLETKAKQEPEDGGTDADKGLAADAPAKAISQPINSPKGFVESYEEPQSLDSEWAAHNMPMMSIPEHTVGNNNIKGHTGVEREESSLKVPMVHVLPWSCWTNIETFQFSKGTGRRGACEYGVVDLALHTGASISRNLLRL